MAPYYVTWVSVIILSFIAQSYEPATLEVKNGVFVRPWQTRAAFAVATFILVFVGGCRYKVGADFMPYYNMYSYYMEQLPETLKKLDEPGIFVLYRIATLIYDDPFSCIFLSAAVTTVIGLRIIEKYSENLKLGMLLYMFVVWHTCFNGVRQALAVAVLFCGYESLKDRKFWKWCLTVFLAFLFHRSSAVVFLVYFFVHRKISIKNLFILSVGAIVILRLYNVVFETVGWLMDKENYVMYYNAESSNYISRSVNILRIAFEVTPAAFFLIAKRNSEYSDEDTFYTNLLVLHAVLAVATMGSAYMARMTLYTMPFAIVAICNLVPELGRGKAIWSPAFVCAFAFFGWYEIYNNSWLQPFRWIWER